MRRKLVYAITALGIVAIVVVIATREPTPAPGESGDSSAKAPNSGGASPASAPQGASPANAAKATNPATRVTAQPSAPLPPANTSVKDVMALLKADADRGVPQAACRVGEELTRCFQVKQSLEIRAQLLSRLGSVSPNSEEGRSISLRANDINNAVYRDLQLCQDVVDTDVQEAWRYLLKAALAGNLEAQAQFAVNPPLSAQDPLGSLDGWNAYRQYAPEFLRRSIEGGNVRALYLACFSAASGMGPGGQAVGGRDPYQALVYCEAALPLVDPQTAQGIRTLLPQLQSQATVNAAQATQEGQALRARAFAGKEPTDVSSQVGTVRPAACAQ